MTTRRHLVASGAALGLLLVSTSDAASQVSLDWAVFEPNANEGHRVVLGPGEVFVFGATAPVFNTLSSPAADYYAARYDAAGQRTWETVVDGFNLDDRPTDAVRCPSGELAFVGLSTIVPQGPGLSYTALITRLDTAGAVQWSRRAGGGAALPERTTPYDLAADSQDNVLFAGSRVVSGLGVRDQLVQKWSPAGALLWERTLHLGNSDEATHVLVLPGDELLVVGVLGDNPVYGASAARLDAAGNVLWTRLVGTHPQSRAFGLAQTSPDRVVLAGQALGGAFLAQFDFTAGVTDWARVDPLNHFYTGVAHDGRGALWAAGQRGNDWVVTRNDTGGGLQSTAVHAGTGSTDWEWARRVHAGAAGQAWVSGFTWDSGRRSLGLVQVDGAGSLVSVETREVGAAGQPDLLLDAARTADNRMVVTGLSAGAPTQPGTVRLFLAQYDLSESPAEVCTPKVNSLGCTPRFSFSGLSSASSAAGFVLRCEDVRNAKAGLYFYGTQGAAALPFQGGTLCLATPVRRSPARDSGGAPPPAADCSGVYSMDLNAFAHGALGGHPDPQLLAPGTEVHAQAWSRDPGASFHTGLSGALRYTVLP